MNEQIRLKNPNTYPANDTEDFEDLINGVEAGQIQSSLLEVASEICLKYFYDDIEAGVLKKDLVLNWDKLKSEIPVLFLAELENLGVPTDNIDYEKIRPEIEKSVLEYLDTMIRGVKREYFLNSERLKSFGKSLGTEEVERFDSVVTTLCELIFEKQGNLEIAREKLKNVLVDLNNFGKGRNLITSAISMVFSSDELSVLENENSADNTSGDLGGFLSADTILDLIRNLEKQAEKTVDIGIDRVNRGVKFGGTPDLSHTLETNKTPEQKLQEFILGPNYSDFFNIERWNLEIFNTNIESKEDNIKILLNKSNQRPFEKQAEKSVKQTFFDLYFNLLKRNNKILSLITGLNSQNTGDADAKRAAEKIVTEIIEKIFKNQKGQWLVDFLNQKGLSNNQKFFALTFIVFQMLLNKDKTYKKNLKRYKTQTDSRAVEYPDETVGKLVSLDWRERLTGSLDVVLDYLYSEDEDTSYILLNGNRQINSSLDISIFYEKREKDENSISQKNLSLIRKMVRTVFDDMNLKKGYISLGKRLLAMAGMKKSLGETEAERFLRKFIARYVLIDLSKFDL